MKKKERKGIMRIFALLGGVIALIDALSPLTHFEIVSYGVAYNVGYGFLELIILLVLAIITLSIAVKPEDTISLSWQILFILGVLLILFGSLFGGILLLIGAIIGMMS